MEQPHEQQYASGHEGGHREPLKAVELNDVIDNYDKRAGGAADLHGVATESRNDEAADNGCDKTHRGADTARDCKRNRQRKGHDTHNDAGHEIAAEFSERIIFQRREDSRFEIRF